MRTIYLHIGTGKTGTTSIQVFLEQNAQLLRTAHRIVVPDFAGRRNHRKLTLYALDDGVTDNLRKAKRITTQAQIDHFRNGFAATMREQAAGWADDETVVFTSEQMTRLKTVSGVRRLQALLAPYCDRICVVVYLRRQDSYLVSEYSQLIKGGQFLRMEEVGARAKRGIYNYEAFLQPWAEVFGAENITVRVFERSQLLDGDVVADFMQVLGITDLSAFARPQEDQNPSLDMFTAEFLRRLNPHIPRWIDSGSNPARGPLIALLESLSNGPRIALPADQAARFMERFAASNAAVARNYLGRADGVLFRETAGAQSAVLPTLDLDKAVELTAALYQRLFAELPKPARRADAQPADEADADDDGPG